MNTKIEFNIPAGFSNSKILTAPDLISTNDYPLQLQNIFIEFAYLIGPIAPIIMQECIDCLDYTIDSFPEDGYEELIGLLAKEISDPGTSELFLKKAFLVS